DLSAHLAGNDQLLRPDRPVHDAAGSNLEKVGGPHLAAQSALDSCRRGEAELSIDLRALVEDGADLAPTDQAGLGRTRRNRTRRPRFRLHAPPPLPTLRHVIYLNHSGVAGKT